MQADGFFAEAASVNMVFGCKGCTLFMTHSPQVDLYRTHNALSYATLTFFNESSALHCIFVVSRTVLRAIKQFYLQIARLPIYHWLTLLKESYLLHVAAISPAIHRQLATVATDATVLFSVLFLERVTGCWLTAPPGAACIIWHDHMMYMNGEGRMLIVHPTCASRCLF